MTTDSLVLSWTQTGICLAFGCFLSLIYLGLLWLTVKSLPNKKHKGIWLFVSAVIRLTLFLAGAVLFSQNNAARFLWIVIGFIITRLIIVGFIKTRRTT